MTLGLIKFLKSGPLVTRLYYPYYIYITSCGEGTFRMLSLEDLSGKIYFSYIVGQTEI